MATSKEYGLGEFDFARGWFMVGTSADATRTPAPINSYSQSEHNKGLTTLEQVIRETSA